MFQFLYCLRCAKFESVLIAVVLSHALFVSAIAQQTGVVDAIQKHDQTGPEIIPLQNAHAHNDYSHERPLLDALKHGFCSVEADIFLVDGELLVGHNSWSVKKGRTLEKLYLEPLGRIASSNNGSVHPNGGTFTLLIEFRKDGQKIYPVLKQQLEKRAKLFSGLRDGKFVQGAVQVVISGACPRGLIKQDNQRLVGIDGRLHDLDSNDPAHLIPLISARWGSHFKWRGHSDLADSERNQLAEIVAKAHASNRKVRFWATPESPVVWKQLLDSGVDFLNTDKLAKLRDFLIDRQKPEQTKE